MKLSEMIAQAIAELRDDGCDEPSNDDIRQMIYAIYFIAVEVEDIAKVRGGGKYELVASPWYDGLLTASESQRLFSGEQLAAYRCTCPLSPVRCSNPVGAQGGLCGPCSTGDHSGHWRAPRQEVGA